MSKRTLICEFFSGKFWRLVHTLISVCGSGCLGKARPAGEKIHNIFQKKQIIYTVFPEFTQKEELLKPRPSFSYTKIMVIFLIVQSLVF